MLKRLRFKPFALYETHTLLDRSLRVLQLSTKLELIGPRLVSNGLIFSDDILVDSQLITFLLLYNYSKLSIETKTKKF